MYGLGAEDFMICLAPSWLLNISPELWIFSSPGTTWYPWIHIVSYHQLAIWSTEYIKNTFLQILTARTVVPTHSQETNCQGSLVLLGPAVCVMQFKKVQCGRLCAMWVWSCSFYVAHCTPQTAHCIVQCSLFCVQYEKYNAINTAQSYYIKTTHAMCVLIIKSCTITTN